MQTGCCISCITTVSTPQKHFISSLGCPEVVDCKPWRGGEGVKCLSGTHLVQVQRLQTILHAVCAKIKLHLLFERAIIVSKAIEMKKTWCNHFVLFWVKILITLKCQIEEQNLIVVLLYFQTNQHRSTKENVGALIIAIYNYLCALIAYFENVKLTLLQRKQKINI